MARSKKVNARLAGTQRFHADIREIMSRYDVSRKEAVKLYKAHRNGEAEGLAISALPPIEAVAKPVPELTLEELQDRVGARVQTLNARITSLKASLQADEEELSKLLQVVVALKGQHAPEYHREEV